MLGLSFTLRTQRWLLAGLATASSERCKLKPPNFRSTSIGRLYSTSQASVKPCGDDNTDLPPAAKRGLHPSAHPAAVSSRRRPSPDDTATPTDPTSKRPRFRRSRRCVITTLDPTQLDSSCFLDLSSRTYIYVYDFASPESPYLMHMAYTISSEGSLSKAFPPDTRGFLYFHPDAHNPLLSQIRFRIANDPDPARSFASGHDLTYGSGYMWYIPLMSAKRNHVLREMLVRDGLIDDALLAQLHAFPLSTRSHRLKRAISVLDQPFIYDFKNMYLCFVVRVAGEDRLYKTEGPLTHYREKSRYWTHDAGAALCRLERSTFPQHAGRRILVMRLLKILQPPELRPDLSPTCNVRVPAEGELFTSAKGVWCRNADKRTKGGEILRLLYDAPDDGHPAFGRS